MILVVEGISPSGKSSWCDEHCRGQVVEENGRLHDAGSGVQPLGCCKILGGTQRGSLGGRPRTRTR